MNKYEKRIEGNALIDEFMGDDFHAISFDYDAFDRLPGALLYDVSWDWLMPVIEKIWEITGCRVLFHHEYDGETIFGNWNEDNTNIEDAYEAAVNFIHYYNKK